MENTSFIGWNTSFEDLDNLDKKSLTVQIRFWAHSLDKQLQLCSSRKIEFSPSRLEFLSKRLQAYEEKYDTSSPYFKWARKIEKLYSNALKDKDKFVYPWQDNKPINISIPKFERLLFTRRSIRKFNRKRISDDLIRKVITYGAWAPNTCNMQALRYVVAKSPRIKQQIKHDLWGNMGHCVIAVIADLRFYNDYNIDGPAHDSGAAIQNILLGSHSLGLGACYISDKGVNSTKYRGLLKIREYEKITAFIWLGRYDKTPIVPDRVHVTEIIEFV